MLTFATVFALLFNTLFAIVMAQGALNRNISRPGRVGSGVLLTILLFNSVVLIALWVYYYAYQQ